MGSHRHLHLAGLLAFALLAAGCDDDDILITDPDGDIAFETVLLTQDSDLSDSIGIVIDDQAEWDDVWDEIGRGGPPPDIDFRRDELLLVSAGSQPNGCYSLQIRRVRLRGGLLEVDADLNEPGSGCVCPQGIVRPVHVVRIRETGRRADFNIDRIVRDCR
jgi:PrcB C-terminal